MGATQSLVIHSDAEILGRTPVFVSTRVPFQALIDYLSKRVNHWMNSWKIFPR